MTVPLNLDRLSLHRAYPDNAFRIAGIRPLDPKESKAYMNRTVLRTWDLPSILRQFHGESGHYLSISRVLCFLSVAVAYALGMFVCYLLGLSENHSSLGNVMIPGMVGFVAGAAYFDMVHNPLKYRSGLTFWRESPIGGDGKHSAHTCREVLHPEALRLVQTLGALLPRAQFFAVCFDTDPVLRMRLRGSSRYYDLMIWDGEDIVLIHPYLS